MIRFRPFNEISAKYLEYFLKSKSYWQSISEFSAGIAIPNVNASKLAEIEIPLPPLSEQCRIVAKLEMLLGKVEACQQRLAKIPVLLKRFRQAVLDSLFTGESKDVEKIWKAAPLGELANIIDPNPSHRYPSYVNGVIPILSTQEFKGLDDWDTLTAKLVPLEFYEQRKAAHGFVETDIIFARKGRLGLARRPPRISKYTFSHTIFLIRAKDAINSDFLLWSLRRDSNIAWLEKEMNSNTGVPTLGKACLAQLPIPVPPFAQQQEIVRHVKALFQFANQLETRYLRAKAQMDELQQSILAKAFRGELVPTEAKLARQEGRDYEPAAILLERIRAERISEQAKPKRTLNVRKPAMTKVTKETVKKVIDQFPQERFSFDELRKKAPADYEALKEVLFTLLSETEPYLKQVFDQDAKAMRFIRSHR